MEYWDGEKKPFSDPVVDNFIGIRNKHVKSLVKVSHDVKSCITHNAQFKKGYLPLNLLSDTKIALINKKNASQKRQIVSESVLESLSKEEVEGWLVLHCVYRSQTEYLASLIRGRGHTTQRSTIKNNRWGLRNPSGSILRLAKSNRRIRYRMGHYLFLRKHSLCSEILKARGHLTQRRKELDDLLKSNPNILIENLQSFQGTIYQHKN